MPIKAKPASGGFVALDSASVPKRFFDCAPRIAEALRDAKLPKSAKHFDDLAALRGAFDAEQFRTVQLYSLEQARSLDPQQTLKKRLAREYPQHQDPVLTASNMPLLHLSTEGNGERVLLPETAESFSQKVELCSKIKKTLDKCAQVLCDKGHLIMASVPEAYLYDLRVQYDRKTGQYSTEGFAPSLGYGSNPFSFASTLQTKGYEVLEAADELENFAIAQAYAVFNPHSGLFMDKNRYCSAPLSAALLFEDAASAKRSRSANRLSSTTLIASVQVRALRVELNDKDLPTGKFEKATALAEKQAFEKLMREQDIERLRAEHAKMLEILRERGLDGLIGQSPEQSAPKRKSAL